MFETILDYGMIGPSFLIFAGMLVLVGGGESLVRGASRLAVALKIPPLIVGLTIVAFCTSAPELSVSLLAALKGNPDIAIGNVVGSNICNICLILGLSALLKPIAVSSTLIRREIPLMVFFSGLMFLFAFLGAEGSVSEIFRGEVEGRIFPRQGLLLLIFLAVYVAWTIYEVLVHKNQNEEYVKEIEEETHHPRANSGKKPSFALEMLTNFALLGLGILLLVVGSEMMVQGAVKVAQKLGVSELIIGLTVLAVGTSLPEMVVSLMSAFKGKVDIAVGNVVGSNIFNVLGVLGPTALFSGTGVAVSPQALRFDMPVLLLVSLLCTVICITGHRVSRGEGLFLLLCYFSYIAMLCFSGSVPV